MFEDWENIFVSKFQKDDLTFNELYDLLMLIKSQNLDRKFAYDLLVRLRNSKTFKLTEKNDDLVLELMDIVTGFCSPNLKIW
jgi:hypothetical protein